jgi:hypothetical protein
MFNKSSNAFFYFIEVWEILGNEIEQIPIRSFIIVIEN